MRQGRYDPLAKMTPGPGRARKSPVLIELSLVEVGPVLGVELKCSSQEPIKLLHKVK